MPELTKHADKSLDLIYAEIHNAINRAKDSMELMQIFTNLIENSINSLAELGFRGCYDKSEYETFTLEMLSAVKNNLKNREKELKKFKK